MRLESPRHVALLWTSSVDVFALSAWASSGLRPGTQVARPPLSYYVGLFGLLGIGLALGLTWEWVGRAGPASAGARFGIRGAATLLGVIWALAMIFPFL